jgi:hypothetical protein
MSNSIVSFIAAGCLFVISAAPASIGFVRSVGDLRVDGSVVRSNATIFDGDVIETTATRTVVQLNDVQLTLAPESRAKVYHDRTVLEKGTGMLRDAGRHFLQAAALQISTDARDSVVQVDLQGTSHVSVFAFSGSAQVHNSSGLLIASLSPGMALAFDTPPQASGNDAVKLSGKVTEREGKFFLTDATTKVTVQIQGTDLASFVGKNVAITGSVIPGVPAALGASQVVQVTSESILAGAGGGAAAATGLAVGAKLAIIGGVAVVGTTGGLAAAGTFSSGSFTSVK